MGKLKPERSMTLIALILKKHEKNMVSGQDFPVQTNPLTIPWCLVEFFQNDAWMLLDDGGSVLQCTI